MAAVFCACFSRSAMRLRSRVMRTRSSRSCGRPRCCGRGGGRRRRCRGLARLARDLRQGRGIGLGQPAILAGALGAGDVDAGFGDELAHRRRLALGRRAAGRPAAAGAGRCGRCGRARRGRGRGGALAAGAAGRGGRCGSGGRRDAVAPSAITPSTAPTSTVAPASARISPSVPGWCGIDLERHLVGLELEQRLVALRPARPTAFSHLATVASVTDSPRVGTTILVAMGLSGS